MDIRELRYFVQIARIGSVSGAAARLNIAQPALSRQLRKLEDELGAQLLVRHGRGVELTEAGAQLLAEAEGLIEHFTQTLNKVRGGEVPFAGQVVLGVPPTAGLLIVPLIFRRFRARWPEATLLPREGISSSLEEWLFNRRVDVAVLHNPTPVEGVDLQPILSEHMVLVTSPASPAHQGAEPISLRSLCELPLILPSLPHSNRRLLERMAIQHNLRLNVAIEVDSVPLMKAMVKNGFGAAIQTYAGVAREVASGELGARPIERPALPSTICIGTAQESKSSWMIMEVARMLRSCIAELVQTGAWAGARTIAEPDEG
ncbi:MAG: transcriptional regulator [Rhizobiales bacterium 17-65-6]|nr:MAG: transcriptional regulator [Rhizobiales bacterium 12-68-15]OYX85430.1 MAG: transcriptional regulator [Azorhizobium sp. 32-67-21]OYY07885.1 MAG: transcriptional regulator [Rhizobiales bacterium 35-68-8]OYZ98422.1 MAG: transcriptional regulator [Rhizobiales bacterium 17-65-6]